MGYLHKYPLLKLQRSLLKIRENVLTGTEVLMTSSTQYTWNTKFLRNKATQRMWQHTWDLHRLNQEQYAFAGSVKVTHFTFTGFCGVLCYLIVFFHHCFVVVDVVVLADASVGHLKCFLFFLLFLFLFFILFWIERQTESWREGSCIQERILKVRCGISEKYWRIKECDKNISCNQLYKEMFSPVLAKAFFVIARNWKQPWCLSTEKWIKKI